MGRDEIDVRPVLGELALEVGDALLGAGDLALDELDRARAGRAPRPLGCSACVRGAASAGGLLGGRGRAAQVLGPAARVGDEPAVLDREQPPGDRVEERPVVA